MSITCIFLNLLDAFFKFTFTFAKAFHEFRNFTGAEKDEDDQAYQQHFLHAESHKRQYRIHNHGFNSKQKLR